MLCLAAWQRGAEYDEQYTLFLTSGVARPRWPDASFPTELVQRQQTGTASLGAIAGDLRSTDVHPPLYFVLVALWRAAFGPGLFTARLFSVGLGLGCLALAGLIAQTARISAARVVLLTLGCYAFTYTGVIARGFALAQLLVLGGCACLMLAKRRRTLVVAGALFGAATFTNYLAVFAGGACLLDLCRRRAISVQGKVGALLGFAMFIPPDLWWFLAQRGSRQGQFPPFSLVSGLTRTAERFSGAILGGLPLYLDGMAAMVAKSALGVAMVLLVLSVLRRWGDIAGGDARSRFLSAALGPPVGLLALGAIFNNTPVEVRYLALSAPFVALLLAAALSPRATVALLTLQAASIAGLIWASPTMQPARAAAREAAALVGNGVVLLPRGNDGVGVVGAFAIEAPPALPLLLVSAGDTPETINARVAALRRVVIVTLEQDDASRAASAAMRQAMAGLGWREIAHGRHAAAFEHATDAR